MRSFVVSGGRLVLAGRVVTGDLRVEDGVIAEVAPHVSGAPRIDAREHLVMPGAVELDFRFERGEDLQQRTRAAVHGGVTALLATGPREGPFESERMRAAATSVVPCGALAWLGPDVRSVPEHARGVRIDGDSLHDARTETLLTQTSLPVLVENDHPARVKARRVLYGDAPTWADHARIHDLDTSVAAVRHAMELARRHGLRVHLLHVSTAEELLVLAESPDRVSAGVRGFHLALDEETVAPMEGRGILWPPVRGHRHLEALWEGLSAGLLTVVSGGDRHVPVAEKEVAYAECPRGAPASEWLLPVLLAAVADGRCSLPDVARWTADQPARLARLPRKGRIEVGFDADLVLVDPRIRAVIGASAPVHSPSGWSPFAGRATGGAVVRAWVAGEELLVDDEIRQGRSRVL